MSIFNRNNNKETISLYKNECKRLEEERNRLLDELNAIQGYKEEYENLIETGSVIIDVVGRCERNVWNGNITPQIIVEEYQIISKLHYF